MHALRPTATQLLYRFTDAATRTQVDAGLGSVTADLPPASLLASQSYLVRKEVVAAGPGVYVPFLVIFGVLGLVVAVLIVANVLGGLRPDPSGMCRWVAVGVGLRSWDRR
jgi:putative ABC transport system permease protein